MSAFRRKADIECADDRQKKARYKTGLSIFGSGGALYELYADRDCTVPFGRLMSAFPYTGHSDAWNQ
jgi:hypothetical protein